MLSFLKTKKGKWSVMKISGFIGATCAGIIALPAGAVPVAVVYAAKVVAAAVIATGVNGARNAIEKSGPKE